MPQSRPSPTPTTSTSPGSSARGRTSSSGGRSDVSLFLNNASATLYGASRLTFDLTSAGTENQSGESSEDVGVIVKVYTCTSTGTLTERGSGSATWAVGNVAVSVTVATDGAAPTNGGVTIGVDVGGGEVYFFSPTGLARVAAGTHAFNIHTEEAASRYFIQGGGVSYGPDTLVECGPWEYDLAPYVSGIVEGAVTQSITLTQAVDCWDTIEAADAASPYADATDVPGE